MYRWCPGLVEEPEGLVQREIVRAIKYQNDHIVRMKRYVAQCKQCTERDSESHQKPERSHSQDEKVSGVM